MTRTSRRISLSLCVVFCAALLLSSGGCAAGLGGLIALVFSGGGGDGGTLLEPTVASVDPRQSAVVGGVEVEVKGVNFDEDTVVSVGGKAATTTFVDERTLRVTIPFNDLGGELRYTETNPNLTLKVVNQSTESVAPFFYMRPRLRDVYIEEAGQKVETYGHRFERRSVFLEGDFFGFASPLSNTTIEVVRKKGNSEVVIAELEAMSEPADESAVDQPAWWIDEECPGGAADCAVDLRSDPHQGQRLRLRLPVLADVPDALKPDFISGPEYVIRVTNENGEDEIDFGFAPPFPAIGLVCQNDLGQSAILSWSEPVAGMPGADGLTDTNGELFDVTFIDRYDPDSDTFVNVGVVFEGDFAAGELRTFEDTTVDTTNYVYRVYGRIGDQNTPALSCEVSIVPDGEVDLVLDLGEDDFVQPVVEKASLGTSSSFATATGIQGLDIDAIVQENGRPVFLLRPQRNVDDASRNLGTVLDSESTNVSITWVSTGPRATFTPNEVENLKQILRYYSDSGATGGLYLEGRHLLAFLEVVLEEDEISSVQAELPDADPDKTELEVLFIDRRLGGFDPTEGQQAYETIDEISVDGGDFEPTWNGDGGITVYRRDDFDDRGAEVARAIVSGTARRPGRGDAAVGAVLFERPESPSFPVGARTILSTLDIGGFATSEQRVALIERFIRILDPGASSAVIAPIVRAIEPAAVPWDVETDVVFRGDDLGLVEKVKFGKQEGAIIGGTADSITVRTPVANLPGRYPVLLQASTPPGAVESEAEKGTLASVSSKPGDLPRSILVGEVQFGADAPRGVIFNSATVGPLAGGNPVQILGSNFTRAPDTQVLFGGRRAALREVSRDQIILVVPPGDEPGPVDVEIRTNGGVARLCYTYCADGGECPSACPNLRVETVNFGFDVGSRPEIDPGFCVFGSDLTGDEVVLVGGRPLLDATFFASSGEEGGGSICGLVPPGCGRVDVTIQAGEEFRTVPGGYRYISAELLGFDYFPRSPLAPQDGGILSVDVSNFGGKLSRPRIEVFLDGELLEENDGDTYVTVPPARDDQIGRQLDLSVRYAGSPCEPAVLEGAFGYGIPVLFLGEFAFDVTDDDPTDGGSHLASTLLARGFAPQVIENPTSIDLNSNNLRPTRFPIVFFSQHPFRSLSDAEVRALGDFALSGGILVLLGQHGSTDPGVAEPPGGDATDRNRIASFFGMRFDPGVFSDPESKIPYNGCTDNEDAFGCPPVPGDPREGDPDLGEEWPILRVVEGGLSPEIEAVFRQQGDDVRDVRLLFNWGQSISLIGGKFSASAVMVGSSAAYSDRDAPFEQPRSFCEGYFENAFTEGDVRGGESGLIGVAAADLDFFFGALDGDGSGGGDTSGGGTVVCIGDQEWLSNRFFHDQCTDGSGYNHRTLIENLLRAVLAQLGVPQLPNF